MLRYLPSLDKFWEVLFAIFAKSKGFC